MLAAIAATILCTANLAQAQVAPTPSSSAVIQDRIDAKNDRLDKLNGKKSKRKSAKAARVQAKIDLLVLRKARAVQIEDEATLTRLQKLQRREGILEARIAQIDAALASLKYKKSAASKMSDLEAEKAALNTKLTAVKAKIARHSPAL